MNKKGIWQGWGHDLLPSRAWEARMNAPALLGAWARCEHSPLHTEQGSEVNERGLSPHLGPRLIVAFHTGLKWGQTGPMCHSQTLNLFEAMCSR
jgi:hypothetical protein